MIFIAVTVPPVPIVASAVAVGVSGAGASVAAAQPRHTLVSEDDTFATICSDERACGRAKGLCLGDRSIT